MFLIRNTFVRIRMRIRILGSVPSTNGSGCGCGSVCGFGSGSSSCPFRQRPSRCQQKNFLSLNFRAYSFLKVHLHHSSKIKVIKKSQNSRNLSFSSFFCLLNVDKRIRIRTNKLRIRIQEAQKHKDAEILNASVSPLKLYRRLCCCYLAQQILY